MNLSRWHRVTRRQRRTGRDETLGDIYDGYLRLSSCIHLPHEPNFASPLVPDVCTLSGLTKAFRIVFNTVPLYLSRMCPLSVIQPVVCTSAFKKLLAHPLYLTTSTSVVVQHLIWSAYVPYVESITPVPRLTASSPIRELQQFSFFQHKPKRRQPFLL